MSLAREVKAIAVIGLVSGVLLGAAPFQARAQTPTSSEPQANPPDVRRGEPYDGRASPHDPWSWTTLVPTVLLFVPRMAVTLLSRAAVATLDWLEQSGVGPALRRTCYPFGERLVILPTAAWERGLTPEAGLSLSTNLLFGKSRRAYLRAEAGAGHRRVWHASLEIHPLGRPSHSSWRAVALALSVSYSRRRDRPFFGRGYMRAPAHTSADALQARLDQGILLSGATLTLGLWRSLRLEVSAGLDWRRLHDAAPPDPTPTTLEQWALLREDLVPRRDPTFAAQVALSVGGALGRPVPAPGIRARVRGLVRVGGEELGSHLLLGGAVEAFAPAWGSSRRLGLRAGLLAAFPLAGGSIPALFLPCMGGPSTMRGFSTGRFCGETGAYLSMSYHQALAPRLWLEIFVDWGGAFREGFRGADLSGIDLGGGASVALDVSRGSWMRLLLAGSRDGVALFLGFEGAP